MYCHITYVPITLELSSSYENFCNNLLYVMKETNMHLRDNYLANMNKMAVDSFKVLIISDALDSELEQGSEKIGQPFTY